MKKPRLSGWGFFYWVQSGGCEPPALIRHPMFHLLLSSAVEATLIRINTLH